RAFPRDHVGFGRGIHLCVGAPLARLEAEIVLGALIDATTSIEPGDLPPERVNSLMIRRFETLPLTIVP
ncbi:MAG: cytochrome P450, partial [Acidimicrobiales bacterium]|nr:cytochrome P450 [Acidimicrobiales bacterium]